MPRAVRWQTSSGNGFFVPALARREAGPGTPSLLSALSPWQRGALGIPMPGAAYWTAETVGLLARRYPTMDTRPYAAGLAAPAKL